ncbi:hypothetical protein [Ferribacterium limneticum]|uniref:hypothetical protein n=1 Tax=Ferribacterium limneticum TaxID=76259 RepID=UPI001CF8770F|nr:hypothetical protein [Ferribacterium limneticum]UCV26746.1 hypothetical protein KI617_10535 [Ferribacterium limneticum]UCV30663.1 hypothetical protein KI608_10535 [Ferribacterium limneticum]
MRIIAEDIWLCQDCLMVAVNGDYTGLDYYLTPEQAARRVKEIDAGLAKLPHLVPDFNLDEEEWECLDCGKRAKLIDCPLRPDPDGDGGLVHSCPDCAFTELRRREEGFKEFSWNHCGCCGSHDAGSRHRFAQLGE